MSFDPAPALVQAGSIRLNVASMGQGRPVVLLHGFPETHYCWRKVMPALAEEYRVLAPDLRGYGLSDKPDNGYDKKTLAGDVAALLDALGLDKIVLVGHDWGGGVAYRFALDYTERVEKLVIIDMAALHIMRMPPLIQLLRSYYIYLFQIPRLPEWYLSRDPHLFFARALIGTSVNKQAFTREDIDYYAAAFPDAASFRGPVNYYRAMLRKDLQDVKPHINRVLDVPHLIIWGEKDRFLDVKLLEGLDRYFPNLVIRRIPDCGHFVPEEQPELVVRYITDFIKSGGK